MRRVRKTVQDLLSFEKRGVVVPGDSDGSPAAELCCLTTLILQCRLLGPTDRETMATN